MVGREGQSPGLRGKKEYGVSPPELQRSHAQGRPGPLSSSARHTNKSSQKIILCSLSFMLILNKYVRRFIDVPLLFICFFCRGRTMSWKKFCAIWREQLEVHNSLSVEMKSATLGCGQLSLVAGRGLRRHLCKCQAFVCT